MVRRRHYEIVSGECARGVQDVQLSTRVPVVFGVLTTETLDPALMIVRAPMKATRVAKRRSPRWKWCPCSIRDPWVRSGGLGTVAAFDPERGVGVLRSVDDAVFSFHCVAIADGQPDHRRGGERHGRCARWVEPDTTKSSTLRVFDLRRCRRMPAWAPTWSPCVAWGFIGALPSSDQRAGARDGRVGDGEVVGGAGTDALGGVRGHGHRGGEFGLAVATAATKVRLITFRRAR